MKLNTLILLLCLVTALCCSHCSFSHQNRESITRSLSKEDTSISDTLLLFVSDSVSCFSDHLLSNKEAIQQLRGIEMDNKFIQIIDDADVGFFFPKGFPLSKSSRKSLLRDYHLYLTGFFSINDGFDSYAILLKSSKETTWVALRLLTVKEGHIVDSAGLVFIDDHYAPNIVILCHRISKESFVLFNRHPDTDLIIKDTLLVLSDGHIASLRNRHLR